MNYGGFALVLLFTVAIAIGFELCRVVLSAKPTGQGGRYVPPTSRTAPCKAPYGPHRPREDVAS